MRRITKEDFENKTISAVRYEAADHVTLTFTNGSLLDLWAEVISTPAGRFALFMAPEHQPETTTPPADEAAPKKQLSITVTGPAGSSKTTVALLIWHTLKIMGASTIHLQDADVAPGEESVRIGFKLLEDLSITVTTVQASRVPAHKPEAMLSNVERYWRARDELNRVWETLTCAEKEEVSPTHAQRPGEELEPISSVLASEYRAIVRNPDSIRILVLNLRRPEDARTARGHALEALKVAEGIDAERLALLSDMLLCHVAFLERGNPFMLMERDKRLAKLGVPW